MERPGVGSIFDKEIGPARKAQVCISAKLLGSFIRCLLTLGATSMSLISIHATDWTCGRGRGSSTEPHTSRERTDSHMQDLLMEHNFSLPSSGHGLSGMALLSTPSFLAVPAMFAGGISLAFAIKALS